MSSTIAGMALYMSHDKPDYDDIVAQTIEAATTDDERFNLLCEATGGYLENKEWEKAKGRFAQATDLLPLIRDSWLRQFYFGIKYVMYDHDLI